MPTPIIGTVRISGPVSPFNVEDTYPATDPQYGLGGLRTVGTTAEMEAISVPRRQVGMIVYVSGVTAYYALVGTTANSGWTTGFTFGSGGGGTNILPLNNTFTGTNSFNAGISASSVYSSVGSTFGGTLQVLGGATLSSKVDIGGVLDVVGGVTFESVTDHAGVARFAAGATIGTVATSADFNVWGISRLLRGANIGGGATFSGALGAVFEYGLKQTRASSIIDNAGGMLTTAGATFQNFVSIANTLTVRSNSNSGFYIYSGPTSGTFTGCTLSISPTGRLELFPRAISLVGSGTETSITIEPGTRNGDGYAWINGGDLILGTKQVDEFSPVNPSQIRFQNGNNVFVTRLSAPNTSDSDKVISLPNVTGTVALLEAGNTFTGFQTFTAGLTSAFLYVSSGSTFAGPVRFNGGLTASRLDVSGDATIGATLTVSGNFFVSGTVTTVNRTDLNIDDKTITMGRTLGSDALADGGGLVLKGTSDRTWTWSSARGWESSQGVNIASGSSYLINGTSVLSATALGSGVVSSSLTSVGTISSGTWQGTVVGATYGGTGRSTYAIGDVLYASGTSSLTVLGASTAGRLLSSMGAGTAPEYKQLLIRDADAASVATESTGTGTLILTIQNASTTVKGLAKFDPANFTVSGLSASVTAIDGGSY